MTELSTDNLKKSFHEDMISLYKNMTKIVKHKPTKLLDYINKYGGYEAAVKYITTDSYVQDFAILWEKQHLDLSIESLITSEKYQGIFPGVIVESCSKKLSEYNYAPNIIEEEPEEDDDYYNREEQEDKLDIAAIIKARQEMKKQQQAERDYPLYYTPTPLEVSEWKETIMNRKIFTEQNMDLIIRLYCMGDKIHANEISEENGYSSTYPYKEVLTALGKRVVKFTKIEVPTSPDGKPLWWNVIFNGGFKDNSGFELSIKKNVAAALEELIEEGSLERVEVKFKSTDEKTNQPSELNILEKLNLNLDRPESVKLDDIATDTTESKASILSENRQKEENKIDSIESLSSLLHDVIARNKEIKPVEVENHKVDAISKIPSEQKIAADISSQLHETKKVDVEKVTKDMEEVVSGSMAKASGDNVVTSTVSNVIARTSSEDMPSKVAAVSASTPQAPTVVLETKVSTPLDKVIEEQKPMEDNVYSTKRFACINYYGAICDVCGFDYGYTYGEDCEDLIGIYNVKKHSTDVDDETNPIKDLVPICANCYNVLRRKNISLEKLRKIIKA